MSDTNSINPVGLGATVAVGAAGGAVAPKVIAAGKKYAPAVKEAANKVTDSVVLSTTNVAKKAGSKLADVQLSVSKKLKDIALDASKQLKKVGQKAATYAERGFGAVKKLVPAKVGNFVSALFTNVAKIVKKPFVATALVAGLAYTAVSKLNDEKTAEEKRF